ncbi:MAG: chalcone isomerase family protein [Thiotrichales bacterium]
MTGWWRVIVFLLLAGDLYARSGFPPTIDHDGQPLPLQGAGTAYYLGVIAVYDAALYAATEVTPEGYLVDGQCLAIRYKKPIKRSDFVRAAETILERQHSQAVLADFRTELDRLHFGYTDVEPGDEYRLCYRAPAGLALAFNGAEVIRVGGEGFARLYFGIWLGQRSLSDDLRESLLGGAVRPRG